MIPRTLRGIRVVSFDIDGTLVDPSFVDSFWFDRIPRLLARRTGLSLDRAKARVLEEYDDVGDGDLRWYLPDYWLARLKLNVTARELLRGIRVRVYPEVREVLQD
ncbi:TPA: HAD family hydrolase, partial [Candidatus Bathyarchaeota archaeon]|nr:HAD family hydrolase [Candidatus Bathyarchaeota archaeon]